MRWVIFIAFLSAFVLTKPTYGIEMNGAYDTTAPTSANIPNWNTGWPASNATGWNYVGQDNGSSAVYLGNGWVLTAAHVGAGPEHCAECFEQNFRGFDHLPDCVPADLTAPDSEQQRSGGVFLEPSWLFGRHARIWRE